MALTAGQTISCYEILGLLGAGGMGEVYRARDTRLGRDVALKVLPEKLVDDERRLERFEREAQVLAALNHPNIGSIYQLEETEGLKLLVLELVEGQTLNTMLLNGPLPVQDILRIGRQVAAALEAAHEKGIVHRDLKPANVMLDEKGNAKVLDFGLAKAPHLEESGGLASLDPETGEIADEALAARLTLTGAVMGTPPYMSPEQVRGTALDKRSDIWSFGCLMFELLTNQRPFDRASAVATLGAILHEEPDWERLPATTPPAVQTLIRRCMQKDADVRLHDIADARIEIDELTQSGPLPAQSTPAPRTLAIRAVLGVAVTVVVILALYAALWRDRGPATPDLRTLASIVALPSKVIAEEQEETGLFVDPSRESPHAYLADAVPGTLAAHIYDLKGLETKLPVSSVNFRNIDGDRDRVAESYSADAFIESAVTVEGDALALHVELVDARTRDRLWSGDYTGRFDAYLDLMREAADGLRLALRPDAPPVRMTGPTESAEAELAFRRGTYFARRYDALLAQEDFDRAVDAFERALKADVTLADAAAEIARLHAFRLSRGRASPQEAWPEIEKWAERAVEIDRDSGLAWSILAGLETRHNRDGQEKKRLDYQLRAVCLAPDDPRCHTFLGVELTGFSLSLAAEAFRQAESFDPLFSAPRLSRAGCLAWVGRLEDALSVILETERIGLTPELVQIMKGTILSMLGRTAQAEAVIKELEATEAEGKYPFLLLELRFELAFASGEASEVETLLETIKERLDDPETPVVYAWNLVVASSSALAMSGSIDTAFEMLASGASHGILLPYDYLALNPRLASLRSDPRYPETAASARARFEELLAILEEARANDRMPSYLKRPLESLVDQLESTNALGD